MLIDYSMPSLRNHSALEIETFDLRDTSLRIVSVRVGWTEVHDVHANNTEKRKGRRETPCRYLLSHDNADIDVRINDKTVKTCYPLFHCESYATM